MEFPALHPIFVHFPVALIPAAAAFDVAALLLRKPSLAHAAFFTLLLAAVLSPITAATGWLWLNEMEGMAHSGMTAHKWLGTLIPLLLIPLAAWRFSAHKRDALPSAAFLVLLCVALGAVTIQGHLGGSMTFGNAAHSHDAERPGGTSNDQHGDSPAQDHHTTNAVDEGDWRESIPTSGHHHE